MLWALAAVSGCAEDQYIQTDCTVYTNSVGIWLTKNGEKEDGVPYRVFEFSKKGVMLGVRPIHYAQDWSHVDAIRYEVQADGEFGLLYFVLVGGDGKERNQSAGIINKECWENVNTFLTKNDIEVELTTIKN